MGRRGNLEAVAYDSLVHCASEASSEASMLAGSHQVDLKSSTVGNTGMSA